MLKCAVRCGVYYLRPAVSFQIRALYQLRFRLLRVRVLVASRGQFSDKGRVSVAFQAAEGQGIICVSRSVFR
jgi:hypothetical protein